MQLVVQKVTEASVTVEGDCVATIGVGYLVLVGVAPGDSTQSVEWLAHKLTALRLFSGPDGTINDRTVVDVGGSVLVVSQFTLLGSVEGSNRPDYTAAAPRDEAQRMYEHFVAMLRDGGIANVQTGRFGAHMTVASINDGPVTLLIRR